MYCAKCGVKLADSEKTCPLCGTAAYHPDIKRKPADGPYPTDKNIPETVNTKGLLFVLTVIFAQPILITIFCDLQFNSAITWSGYAAGGVILGYIIFILPGWFKYANPVIFAPVDFAATGLYLLYVSIASDGGWFLSFAFPALGILALIVCTDITLVKYVRKGYLYIIGGTWLALGAYVVLLEFFIALTFFEGIRFVWSIYPLMVCVIFGLMFLTIAICKPLRESLKKVFFL